MATSSTLIGETINLCASNSTHATPDSSPSNTPQSPYSPNETPSVSTFPITTSLIPPSMISMNGIPLPPTMKHIHNKRHTTESNHNHPGTDTAPSLRSRSRQRVRRSTNSSTTSNDRSRSRSRTSKHRKNTNNLEHNNACDDTTRITSDDAAPVLHDNVCDLTTLSTPVTTSESDNSDESDSDIEIIDTVLNGTKNNNNHHDIEMLESKCDTNNNNEGEDNFERYTVGGIGGKLLRKAGWDGNKESLYEKEGPIEQSKKYQSLQRNKTGLGYALRGRHRRKKQKIDDNERVQRALVYPILTRPRALPPPHLLRNHRRIRMPVIQMNNKANNVLNRNGTSNTMETAIEILSDDEDIDEDDDDVLVLDKQQVTERRLKGIAFENIIDKMREEREETTKKYIEKQFAGSKKKIAVTKMVISIKDSYSQTKIVVPVRGKNCKHLQPFDAKCFLLRPKKYQKCTQCNKCIKRKELIKMVYFEKIFNDIKDNYGDNVEQIEIMRNAQWKVVKQKQGKQVMQESAATNDIVDIDADCFVDEKEEEISKKLKDTVIILSSDDDDDDDGDKRKMTPEVVDLLDSSDSDDADEDSETEESGD